MKLLFDPNLSHKLVGLLADLFPDSEHVRNVNLHEADGGFHTIWFPKNHQMLPAPFLVKAALMHCNQILYFVGKV